MIGYFNNFENNSNWNNQNTYDYKNNFDVKFVYCPICSGKALVKSNRRNKKMLRCDLCYALMFAKRPASQEHLLIFQSSKNIFKMQKFKSNYK